MKSGGFTLVELLIALVLGATIVTLAFNALRLGSRTRDAIETQTRAAQDVQLAGEFLRRLIEEARPTGFAGEAQSLQFVAPLPAHFGPGGMQAFALGVAEGKLIIRYQLFQGGKWASFAEREPETAVLARGMDEARFEYLGEQWSARWAENEALPRAIRIHLKPASERQALELAFSPKLR